MISVKLYVEKSMFNTVIKDESIERKPFYEFVIQIEGTNNKKLKSAWVKYKDKHNGLTAFNRSVVLKNTIKVL